MNTDLKTLFENNPDLQEIAHRLENSKKEAAEKNSKLPEGTDPKKFAIPAYCQITDWKMHKDIGFTKAVCEPRPGKEGLEKQLAFIIKLRNPDCVKISLFKGKGQRGAMPILSKETNLKPLPEQLNGVDELRKEIEELKKNTGSASENKSKQQCDALQKKIEEQEWNTKIENLKRAHEKEVELLSKQIEEKDDEIEELKGEIINAENGLQGVQNELKTATDPPLMIMLGRIAEKAIEGAVIRNPEFLEKVCKVDRQIVQAMMNDIRLREKQIENNEKKEDNSGFSETPDEYEGLKQDHKTAIQCLIKIFKEMPFDQLEQLLLIFCNLQIEGGQIDKAKAAKVLEYVESLNTESK